MNWQSANKLPKKKSGFLVIESDDGKLGTYKHWLPLMERVARKYSKFYPNKITKVTPNVNTGFVMSGDNTYMTPQQLHRLYHEFGWEMVSHGRWHAGMGKWNLTEAVSQGDTIINMEFDGRMKEYGFSGYEYIIEENGISEVIRKISGTNATQSDGTIVIDSPLQNSYTTNATIQLTDESRVDELQGCIDDFNSMGIPNINHHVFTYHDGSQYPKNDHAVNEVSKIFNSSRGNGVSTGINVPGEANLTNLNALLLNTTITKEKVDQQLSEAINKNAVLIVYGHSEPPWSNAYKVLEHLVEQALIKGVTIIDRERAYQILSN